MDTAVTVTPPDIIISGERVFSIPNNIPIATE